MAANEVILSHYGLFTYDDIGYLLNRTMHTLKSRKLSTVVCKRVYAAMVESLENVYKHQDLIEGDSDYLPKFTLVIDGDYILISSSNSVLTSKIDMIRERLEHVNSLDKAGLKDFYKDIIMNGVLSSKGGAGLGIVNLARVTGDKIDYKFEQIDSQYSYYTLNVKILQVQPQNA